MNSLPFRARLLRSLSITVSHGGYSRIRSYTKWCEATLRCEINLLIDKKYQNKFSRNCEFTFFFAFPRNILDYITAKPVVIQLSFFYRHRPTCGAQRVSVHCLFGVIHKMFLLLVGHLSMTLNGSVLFSVLRL